MHGLWRRQAVGGSPRQAAYRGGTNALGNLASLCRTCHIAKHKRQLGEQEKAWQVLVHETAVAE